MAEEKSYRDKVLEKLELVDKSQAILSGLDSSVSCKRAGEERDKYGLEALTKDSYYPNEKPRYSEDAFNKLSEDEKKQKIEEGVAYRQGKSLTDSIRDFAADPDAVLKEGDKYRSKLIDIANAEIIVNSASEKDHEILSESAAYINYQKIAKDMDEGKPIPPQLKQNIEKIVSAAASKKMYDALKDYPEKLRELGARVAALVPGEITSDSYKDGVKELRDRAKKELVDRYGENFEDKLSEAVGKTLATLVKSSNPKKEQEAASLLYRAEKGYGLGERDFKEVYK